MGYPTVMNEIKCYHCIKAIYDSKLHNNKYITDLSQSFLNFLTFRELSPRKLT